MPYLCPNIRLCTAPPTLVQMNQPTRLFTGPAKRKEFLLWLIPRPRLCPSCVPAVPRTLTLGYTYSPTIVDRCNWVEPILYWVLYLLLSTWNKYQLSTIPWDLHLYSYSYMTLTWPRLLQHPLPLTNPPSRSFLNGIYSKLEWIDSKCNYAWDHVSQRLHHETLWL